MATTEESRVKITLDIAETERKVKELGAQLTKLRNDLKSEKDPGKKSQIRKELEAIKKEHAETKAELGKKLEVIIDGRAAGASINNLNSAIRKLRSELRSIDPRSEAFAQGTARLREMTREYERLNATMRPQPTLWQSVGAQIKGALAIGASFFGLQMLTAQLSNSIRKAAELSDALANVQKTTGLTANEVDDLNKSLGDLNTRTSRKELLGLATEAGKLGIEGVANIKKFVTEADKIQVALGEDLGEGAVTEIAKLSQLFGEGMLNIASAINTVGQSSAATEQYQVDFLGRMSGIAVQSKITAAEIQGYGAALELSKVQAETASTALSQFFIEFQRDTDKFGAAAGFAAGELQNLIAGKGVNEAFIAFLKNIKEASTSEADFLKRLQAVGIDGARGAQTFLALANNVEELQKQQKIANDEMQKGTSVLKEFDTRNNNFAGSLERIQKALFGLATNNILVDGFKQLVQLADQFISTASNSDKATAAFENAKASVQSLEESINPLITRYDELKSKGELNKDEQTELSTIIQQIANILPATVKEFDKYGNALDINRDKVKGFMKEQSKFVQDRERGAIDALKKDADSQAKMIDLASRNINKAIKDAERWGTSTASVQGFIKDAETKIAVAREKLIEINEKLTNQYQSELPDSIKKYYDAAVKAKFGAEQETKKEESTPPPAIDYTKLEIESLKVLAEAKDAFAIAELKRRDEELQKLNEYRRKLNDLYDQINKAKSEGIKNQYEREGVMLAAKYDDDRKKALQQLKEINDDQKLSSAQKIEFKKQTDELLLQLEGQFNTERQSLVEKAQKELSDIEFQEDVKNLKDALAEQKLIYSQQYADGIINREQYNDAIRAAEKTHLENMLQTYKDYGKHTGEVEQQIADNRIKIIDNVTKDDLSRMREKLDLQQRLAEKNSSEQLDITIAQIENERDIKLAAYKDDAEMRVLINAEADKSIEEARLAHAQRIADQTAEYFTMLLNIVSTFNQMMFDQQNKELSDYQKANEKKKKALKDRLDNELISEEEYNKQIEALDAEAARKTAAIKRDQFKKQQEADIVQSIINTAVAVTKALPNIPLSVLAGVLGAAQTVLIASKPVPEFASGVKLEKDKLHRIEGAPHTDGGIDLIERKSGRPIGNMEGDEGLYIFSKRTTQQSFDVLDTALEASKGGKALVNVAVPTPSPLVEGAGGEAKGGKALVNVAVPTPSPLGEGAGGEDKGGKALVNAIPTPALSLASGGVFYTSTPTINTERIRDSIRRSNTQTVITGTQSQQQTQPVVSPELTQAFTQITTTMDQMQSAITRLNNRLDQPLEAGITWNDFKIKVNKALAAEGKPKQY